MRETKIVLEVADATRPIIVLGGRSARPTPRRTRRGSAAGDLLIMKVVITCRDARTVRTHGARVVYKDLCVDVTDLDAAAAFLGPLLGLAPEERRDARAARSATGCRSTPCG